MTSEEVAEMLWSCVLQLPEEVQTVIEEAVNIIAESIAAVDNEV